ncbi:superoxide dismutase [Helicobacter cappadocius]|uniref:Superoxide dismutase n=1 Tax=Helicobacter cappadocius TaxID=3063998 RepID=A0AA90PT67_9HELI|nr:MULTISPECIES: superoxide dismutase [unclassified Helicobacter]MDO7252971.1 superoxide dismutase [Helicobacter sp. faydin-H75]MDP2539039.1 superoxide dismutase [Helicobacter sp. faydin-H76]
MFELRKLPYPKDSMGDFLSPVTFDFHYGKHHQTYITNLNALIEGTEFANSELFDIVTKAKAGLFNNAAQVYNHDFYWDCIAPKQTQMSPELQEAINKDFGSLDNFKETYLKSATTLFGSGWCWLVYDKASNKLEIIQTSNAATPVTEGKIPVLVVDVWEHAYYVDHKNARATYLDKFYNHINWEFVSQAYQWAQKEGINSVRFYMNDIHKKA